MAQLDDLAKQCTDPAGPFLVEAENLSAEAAARLAEVLQTRIIVARVVDAAKLRSKQELLTSIAQAFDFPGHFGHNWDALLDCLSDFAWLPAQGHVCIFLHGEALQKADGATCNRFLQVAEEAAQRWRQRQAGFFKLVIGGRARPKVRD